MTEFIGVIIIGITLICALSIVWFTLKNGIPPLPTTRHLCEQAARKLQTVLPQQTAATIVEAGSGWGTLALYLGRQFPRATIFGLENSPLPHYISIFLARLLRRSQCRFLRRDMYHFNYRNVDVVVCYLFPRGMEKLSRTFREQLPVQAMVVSIYFALPDWKAHSVIRCNDIHRTPIYIYLKEEQSWSSSESSR